MNYIEQEVSLLNYNNILLKIEICARNAYNSEALIINENSIRFVKSLIKKGHLSVLEHIGIYLKYSTNHIFKYYPKLRHNKYTTIIKHDIHNLEYIYTNLRVIAELYPDLLERILREDKNLPYFEPNIFDPNYRFTFRIKTDHGQERSFLRHRTNSFTISSTRFINYFKHRHEMSFTVWEGKSKNKWIYKLMCNLSSIFYKFLIIRGENPEVARKVLILGHEANIIMSASRKDLDNFFKLRMAKDSHFQIRKLASKMFHLIN